MFIGGMTVKLSKKKCRCGSGTAEYCKTCHQIARAENIIFSDKIEERNYKRSKEYKEHIEEEKIKRGNIYAEDI